MLDFVNAKVLTELPLGILLPCEGHVVASASAQVPGSIGSWLIVERLSQDGNKCH